LLVAVVVLLTLKGGRAGLSGRRDAADLERTLQPVDEPLGHLATDGVAEAHDVQERHLQKGSSDTEPSLLQTSEKATYDPMSLNSLMGGYAPVGYIPVSSPNDNRLISDDPIPQIPASPDCGVLPQTVVEIQRMRESSSQIARQIDSEVQVMARRKEYIAQMTNYLNDRIRELNKVKLDLAQELKWIKLSQKRIEELAEREKLMKLQDILACLNAGKDSLTGATTQRQAAINTISSDTQKLAKKIQDIRTDMQKTSNGLDGDAGSSTGGASGGATGGAAPAAAAGAAPPATT